MTCAIPRACADDVAPADLTRHTLLWLRSDAALAGASRATPREHVATLNAWITADRPVIVRRPGATERVAEHEIAVGLSLPPAPGERRIAAVISRAAIHRIAPPMTVGEAMPALPRPWQRDLHRLVRDAHGIHIDVRIFGSLAWQALTGLPYVRDGSDADLLLAPSVRDHVSMLIALLTRWEYDTGRRADAELVFPGDAAVSWREWSQGRDAQRVLVKSTARVALMMRGELLARLSA